MDPGEEQLQNAGTASPAAPGRENDLASLMELTRALASSDDIFEILFLVVSRLADLLGVDRGSIVLREEQTEFGIVVASSDDIAMRNQKVSLDKYPEIRKVLETGSQLVIRDVTESPLLSEVLRIDGPLAFSSMALVPIIGEEGPVAALCLKSGEKTDFSHYDLMHAQAVANATGIALNNARTLRQLRDEGRSLFSAYTRDKEKLKELSRYLEVFDSSRDAMLVMDREMRILFANPMATLLSQRQADQLIGSSFTELIQPDQLNEAKQIIAALGTEKAPSPVDFCIRKPTAETIASINFSLVVGESDAILATMRDVTEQRAMARELSHTKEFLERVIESSADGIVSSDLGGKILIYNHAAERLFGYSKCEVLEKMTVDELYPHGVARDIMRRIRRPEYGGEGRLEGYRVEMLTKKGERVPVDLSASLVLGDRRPVGTVGIFTDIREKLAMESRLTEAQLQLQERKRQNAVAEMAGAAAHELNQPLTSVMGYAEFVRRSIQDDPSLSHAIEVILSETQRMADIVRKVGRVTRYETKPYVGGAKIVDLDRSSTPEDDEESESWKSSSPSTSTTEFD